MANHKSAEKRARQAIRKTEVNQAVRGAVRTAEKRLRAAIASNETKSLTELLRTYISRAGKAAQKGVVHPRTVARKVSKLSAQVHKLATKA